MSKGKPKDNKGSLLKQILFAWKDQLKSSSQTDEVIRKAKELYRQTDSDMAKLTKLAQNQIIYQAELDALQAEISRLERLGLPYHRERLRFDQILDILKL
jgi:hypothetical protein